MDNANTLPQPIDKLRLEEPNMILGKYKAGKARLDKRLGGGSFVLLTSAFPHIECFAESCQPGQLPDGNSWMIQNCKYRLIPSFTILSTDINKSTASLKTA
jgi:hypothetical protein